MEQDWSALLLRSTHGQPLGPTLFDHFVSTAERVGIPVVTAASGAYTLYITPTSNIPILPWLGAALILAALATYVWLTARTTVRIKYPINTNLIPSSGGPKTS